MKGSQFAFEAAGPFLPVQKSRGYSGEPVPNPKIVIIRPGTGTHKPSSLRSGLYQPSTAQVVGHYSSIRRQLVHHGAMKGNVLFGRSIGTGVYVQLRAEFLAGSEA